MLVLDEATAAVDNDTEAAIQRSLAQITQQRTTVVIAHTGSAPCAMPIGLW